MREVEAKILEKLHEIKKILDENGGCEQLNICISHFPDAYCGNSNYYSFFNSYFEDGGLDRDNPINYNELEPVVEDNKEAKENESEETTEAENELQKD
jgi:hypothetical protein